MAEWHPKQRELCLEAAGVCSENMPFDLQIGMEVDGEEEEPWSFLFNAGCFPAHNHTLISTGNE